MQLRARLELLERVVELLRGTSYMVSEATADDYRVIATLVNARSSPLRIRIEPWLEETDIDPGSRFFVLARGPEGAMEVQLGEDEVTLWAWVGSVVTVVAQGGVVDNYFWEQLPVPEVPVSEQEWFSVPPGRQKFGTP